MPALNNDFTAPLSFPLSPARLGFFKRIASCCCQLGLLRLAADDEDIFPFLPHCVLLTLLCSYPTPSLPFLSISHYLSLCLCLSFLCLLFLLYVELCK